MDSSPHRLDALQRGLIDAFFARTQRFFLTGDAALSGFYLKHRTTKDLDLFAPTDVSMDEGVDALLGAATAVGATAVVMQQHPDFRRYAVSRGEERTLVDLAIDRTPQLLRDKNHFGAVVVDPMREIAANKIGALLDRFEARDLVDLQLLLRAGLTLAEVLRDAQQKHAGADPATLAWVLGTWRVPPTAPLPEGTTAVEIEAFRDDLVRQLARLALPSE